MQSIEYHKENHIETPIDEVSGKLVLINYTKSGFYSQKCLWHRVNSPMIDWQK